MKDNVAAAISELKPISLDELNETAALHTRKDRKYIVPLEMLPTILAGSDLRVLDINGARSFRYESVYFDTPDLESYRTAAQKRRKRFKVRTRSYVDSGTSLLEVKTRERRGFNAKHRLEYEFADRAQLTDHGREFVDRFEQLAPVSSDLAPALVTRYRRTTLLDTSSSSRITIDTDVEWETPEGSATELAGMAIVETKTAGAPCFLDHRLWEQQIRPEKISKYGTGLAALTPGLSANKWNRVLRRHFSWSPTRPADTGLAATDVAQRARHETFAGRLGAHVSSMLRRLDPHESLT